MRKKNQMYEVELKSKALLKEGKRGLITYFSGGNKKTIAMNVRSLYPQYCKPEDKPTVLITPITYREYQSRVNGGIVNQKGKLFVAEGDIV